MKSSFFLTLLCLLFARTDAFSQAVPFAEFFSQKASRLFANNVSNPQGVLHCAALLAHNAPSYPSADIAPICNEAKTSCIRYGLIQQYMKKVQGPSLENLKKALALGKNELELTLRGCQLAIESSLTYRGSLPNAAGFQ